MTRPVETVTEVTIYPDADAAGGDEGSHFEVRVTYRGAFNGKHGGGYSIDRHGRQLRRKSADDGDYVWASPERFRRWQYRWPDLESALATARRVVATVTCNGMTWDEYQQRTGKR